MMITICSKFGTSELGVDVGVGEGVNVGVAVRGMGVRVGVSEGTGVGVSVGKTEKGTQPPSKTNTRMQELEWFIEISVTFTGFGVL